MKLTLIHPCVGRKIGARYIRTWQMQPLGPATLAGLTPPDVGVKFYDDRMEPIPFAEPTDLVALSVETYTAMRAYQIASEYRRRGVPVVMGGFHPTLVPDEVSEYAESVVIGEAESVWPGLIEDAREGNLRRVYRAAQRPPLAGMKPDRSIFAGKRYLPLGLIEAGRGCHLKCDFCAVQSYFGSTQTRRPIADILDEIRRMRAPLYFFVDDNITSNMDEAKAFFRALIPLRIRWVSQASINAAHDEEFLRLIKASGCQGLLIGIETLNPATLRQMHKGFNTMRGGYEVALANLRRHSIRLYVTFIFGYDEDTPQTMLEAVDFAIRHKFYIVAFNHLTPFPGTPLYGRLQRDGRLLHDRWWLDRNYRYGDVPFQPVRMTRQQVRDGCIRARAKFYRLSSIIRRSFDRQVNGENLYMWLHFFMINGMIRREVEQRAGFPLGDDAFTGELVKVAPAPRSPPVVPWLRPRDPESSPVPVAEPRGYDHLRDRIG